MKSIGTDILKELEALNPDAKLVLHNLGNSAWPVIYGNVSANSLKFPVGCTYNTESLIATKYNFSSKYVVSFIYVFDSSL